MEQQSYVQEGPDPSPDGKVLVLVHGRGASARDILGLAAHLPVQSFTLIAPQARTGSWYPYSFLAPVMQNQPALDQAVQQLADIEEHLAASGVASENIYWLGFSQGACLTLEYVTRHAKKYGGVIAFTGGLIGDKPDETNYQGIFDNTRVFIGSSDPDQHVPVSRVEESSRILKDKGADLQVRIYPGMGHTITAPEIELAVSHVFGKSVLQV